jgi:hypothetical protein
VPEAEKYSSEEHNFSVMFRSEEDIYVDRKAKVNQVEYRASFDETDRARHYPYVTVRKISPGVLMNSDPKTLLQQEKERYNTEYNLVFTIEEREINIDGFPGVDVTAMSSGSLAYYYRLYLVNWTFYHITWAYSVNGELDVDEYVIPFLDSFEFIDKNFFKEEKEEFEKAAAMRKAQKRERRHE